MHAQTRAFVVHRTPTRIRIKIPQRQRQRAYFAAVERVLIEHPDVVRVHSNPLTAGVIIECRQGFDLTAQHCRFLGLQMLETNGALPTSACPAPMAQPNDRIDDLLPTLTLASGALKLIVAVITKQVGVQLIEWAIDAIVQAARHESRRRAIGRQTLLVTPSE
ncbi:hypothetical protein HZZ13_07085 [Bradyrhizobium sp. CNPSo 4010]|uniref:Uncharacterized protein n=1 Tax=Bradyrhizobium agreste TaxID=2751811 RepID=A0ABS0PK15_9BRAD|nr:hypothetical protein [Bradyrhizobium agreste]MBH5397557.1 hypothetical protein [Bradyrhizobium agreste]